MFQSNKALTRAHPTDAGLDIKSSEDIVIDARQSALVSTGLKIAIKEGYVGILKSRSGLAVRNGIDVAAGVIDSAYRGEVKILLRNNSNEPYHVQIGDKIAQLVTLQICLDAYEVVDELDESERGSNGFGSSGR